MCPPSLSARRSLPLPNSQQTSPLYPPSPIPSGAFFPELPERRIELSTNPREIAHISISLNPHTTPAFLPRRTTEAANGEAGRLRTCNFQGSLDVDVKGMCVPFTPAQRITSRSTQTSGQTARSLWAESRCQTGESCVNCESRSRPPPSPVIAKTDLQSIHITASPNNTTPGLIIDATRYSKSLSLPASHLPHP